MTKTVFSGAKAKTLNAELSTSDAITGSLFDERNFAVSKNNEGNADHLKGNATENNQSTYVGWLVGKMPT